MKRQRGRNRKPSGNSGANSANPNRSWDSQGPENIKVRGNAQTVYERYQQLARDASAGGDRVLAENYLQHAEHYFRVLRALQPQRPVSEIAARELSNQGFDIDFEDESGAQAAAFLAAQQAADRAQAERNEREQAQRDGGQGYRDQNNRDGQNREAYRDQNRDQNREWRDRSQPRQDQGRSDASRDDDGARDNDQPRDGEAQRPPRESRKEYWDRRNAERRERDAANAARAAAASSDTQSLDAGPDEQPVASAPQPVSEPDAAALPGFITRATETRDQDAKPAPRARATTPRAPRAPAKPRTPKASEPKPE